MSHTQRDTVETRLSSDMIEKHILLDAPIARVWQALASAGEFGSWFGVDVEGEFALGARLCGRVTTPGYEHLAWDVVVERLEPPRLLAWRWHPNAVDPGTGYSGEPTTLVEFELEPIDAGTLLRIRESGFSSLPPNRRDAAYRGNEQGWSAQLQAIERHVSQRP